MNHSRTRLLTRGVWLTLMLAGLVITAAAPASAHPVSEGYHSVPQQLAAASSTACVAGFAGIYPCDNVDLESFMPLADLGGAGDETANDIWGWTDGLTGREYALIGMEFGTAFVDITVPASPVYLGELEAHNGDGSHWRDIKTYSDHAYIVSESLGHGMQVFDLTELRGLTGPPVTFAETAHYNAFGASHNIVINEDSGFAYAVGVYNGTTCGGGLHMIDISSPASPTAAGCFGSDGYTHDAQCVIYAGPDTAHTGKEICLNSNEDTITIVDVTDKSAPVQISRTPYVGRYYTHQGWLTEDQAYFLLDDEDDEFVAGHNTRTRVFDVSDLDAPSLVGFYDSENQAIDHNQYIKGDFTYQANYRSGLRILDISQVATANFAEVGFFDIYPDNDDAEFDGAWSNYPYFDSGLVIVSGIEQGLYVLRPNVSPAKFCAGKVVTIDLSLNGGNGTGTALDDVILGTPGADLIQGFAGNDTICGGDGADRLRGGSGVDTIFGEAGPDDIRGGGGGDIIDGGSASDAISGQGGGDVIEGGGGDDTINGQGAGDTITGGPGDDTINGQNGGDELSGGSGSDDVRGQTGPDLLRGENDDDTLGGGNGNDTLYGGDGVDSCAGNTGANDMAEASSCETTPGVEILF